MNYGRYEIIKEVGRGSMGVVYQARDPHIDRLIAVKVMRRDRMANDSFVKRFMKEAKVIGRLSHPQIVTIYDVGEEQEEIYITMEFLEGSSLADVIMEGRLEPGRIAELGIQIAETLDYAHRKGVVHRDIKPSNIVIEPDGRAKITDFGIARIEDPSATLQTQTGEIMGTPAYMSPEQVLGNQADGRSDIFSLGVVLYEMSTGNRPFGGEGKTLATVFNDIIGVTPQDPHAKATTVPRDLSGIIMKALSKDPAGRFQTGKEMAEALRSCHEKSEEKTEAAPATGSSDQKKKPNQTVPIVMAVMLAAVIGVGYYLYAGRQTPPPRHPPQAEVAIVPEVVKNHPSQPESKPPPTPSTPKVDRTEAEKPVKNPPALSQKHETKPVHKKDTPVAPPPTEKARTLPKLATLVVSSTPEGARIQIDGKKEGNTPLTLRLPTGKHRIRATLEGFEKIEKNIDLEEAKTYLQPLNMKTMAGSEKWVVQPLVDRPDQ